MKTASCYVIFLLITTNILHCAWCRPVYFAQHARDEEAPYKTNLQLPKEASRMQRQVVQPKWLSGSDTPSIFGDGKVVVTKQNLAEAAALRDSIQKAVREGQFAVEMAQSQSPAAPPANSNGAVNQSPTPLNPYEPAQPPFEFTMPDMSVWTRWLQPIQQAGDSHFMKEMQRVWNDIVENTMRMFTE